MVKLKKQKKKQILNICADISKFPKRYGEDESRNVKAVRFCAKADTTDFAPIKITRQPRFSRKLKCVNMATCRPLRVFLKHFYFSAVKLLLLVHSDKAHHLFLNMKCKRVTARAVSGVLCSSQQMQSNFLTCDT